MHLHSNENYQNIYINTNKIETNIDKKSKYEEDYIY